MNLVDRYLQTVEPYILCRYYKGHCNVTETNADEYPTVCASCNSGRGESFQVRSIKKYAVMAELADALP